MSSNLNDILKNKLINKWGLFWLVSIPVSAVIAVELMQTDLSTGEDEGSRCWVSNTYNESRKTVWLVLHVGKTLKELLEIELGSHVGC